VPLSSYTDLTLGSRLVSLTVFRESQSRYRTCRAARCPSFPLELVNARNRSPSARDKFQGGLLRALPEIVSAIVRLDRGTGTAPSRSPAASSAQLPSWTNWSRIIPSRCRGTSHSCGRERIAGASPAGLIRRSRRRPAHVRLIETEAIFLGDPACSPITVPDRYTDCSPAGIRAISHPSWSVMGNARVARSPSEGFAVNPRRPRRAPSLAFLSLTKLLRDALARDEQSRCASLVRIDDASDKSRDMRRARDARCGPSARSSKGTFVRALIWRASKSFLK